MTEEKQEYAITTRSSIPSSLAGIMNLGQALCRSGLMPRGLDTPQEAVAVLLVARELGFGVLPVLRGDIYVVHGRTELTTRAMLSKIYSSGEVQVEIRYDEEREAAIVEMARPDIGVSYQAVWNEERLKRTRVNLQPGKDKEKVTYALFRKEMKLHRAVGECAQFVCPDIVDRPHAAHTVEEIEAEEAIYTEAEVVREEPKREPVVEGEARQHWIEQERVRKRFWAWTTGTLALNNDEVYAALGVESVKDFDGTMHERCVIG